MRIHVSFFRMICDFYQNATLLLHIYSTLSLSFSCLPNFTKRFDLYKKGFFLICTFVDSGKFQCGINYILGEIERQVAKKVQEEIALNKEKAKEGEERLQRRMKNHEEMRMEEREDEKRRRHQRIQQQEKIEDEVKKRNVKVRQRQSRVSEKQRSLKHERKERHVQTTFVQNNGADIGFDQVSLLS